jgi:alpha-1,2-mannosyltransferase
LAANATKEQNKKICCVIYSGDNATAEAILEKANNRFSIDLRRCLASGEVKFVFLSNRIFIEASSWPRFTMIGQSLGSILLGLEALLKYSPHIYVDSMGYAFTFPIFRFLGGCTVACYVHYPTISTDMLSKITSSEASFNNSADVAKSQIRTSIKTWYYRAFAILYAIVGNRADLIITNSSWTRGHITHIWNLPQSRVLLLFPACDTSRLQKLPLKGREPIVVSLGQYRPEKNHNLQLDAFLELRKKYPALKNVKLAMIGGTRVGNEGDAQIVESLKNRISAEPLLRDCASVLVSIHPKFFPFDS